MILITVDTLTDAWMAASLAEIGLVLMPLHGGGCVYVVVCEYAHVVVTMLSVWQEHTASVCEAYWTIAVDSCTLVYF